MLPRTIVGWIFAILVTVWILRDPAAAGADVRGWIDSGLAFLSSLAGR